MDNKICMIVALLQLSLIGASAQSRSGSSEGRQSRSERSRTVPANEDREFASSDDEDEKTALFTTWVANSPDKNWFLTLQGGPAFLGSENFSQVDLMDNLSFAGSLVLGKWFSPVWGLGFHVSGSKSKSFITRYDNWYIGENHPGLNGQNSPNNYLVGGNFRNDAAYNAYIEKLFLKDATPYPIGSTEGVNNAGWLYDFSYVTMGLDFMVNLRNMFSRYDPEAVFNPVIYGGLGYYHTFMDGDRTAVNGILERFGLQFNFRLSRTIDANLTFEDLMVPEVFDRHVGGDLTQDHVVSAMLGLTIHLGDNIFTKAGGYSRAKTQFVSEPTEFMDEDCRDAINCELNSLRVKAGRRSYNPFVEGGGAYEPVKPKVSRAPEETQPQQFDEEEDEEDEETYEFETDEAEWAEERAPVSTLRRSAASRIASADVSEEASSLSFDLSPVFFQAGSAVVRTSQMISVAKAAVYMDVHPNLTLEIAAFADKKTGTPHSNLRLSEQRANAVADILSSKFGIKRERMNLSFYGDVIQPFPENDQNRVVLFIK